MSQRLHLTIAAVLLSFAVAVPSSAQEEPAAEFEGLVEVSEVLLDVVAVDKKGRVVRGLGKDDFVVVEDGEIVELTGVSFYTTRYETRVPEEAVAAVPPPESDEVIEVPSSSFFVLFFHEQRFAGGHHRPQMRSAGRYVHNWIRDRMSPSDWVAVLSHDSHLHVHQDFTQDRESLMAAIADAARGFQGEDPQPSQWKREAAAASYFSLRRGLPAPPDLRPETRRVYDAIRLVAEATRPIVGRKNLLLFTLGFGEFDDLTLDSRPDPHHYPAMRESLNDNNVALYPIDVTHRDAFSSQATFLLRLAVDTGGLYSSNRVHFNSRIDRIVAENSGYYLLSFRTAHPAGETGYREVRVGTTNREVRLRARRGYRYGV